MIWHSLGGRHEVTCVCHTNGDVSRRGVYAIASEWNLDRRVSCNVGRCCHSGALTDLELGVIDMRNFFSSKSTYFFLAVAIGIVGCSLTDDPTDDLSAEK